MRCSHIQASLAKACRIFRHLKRPTEDGQSLCLSCGLCCDGTAFSFAPLAPDADIAALGSLGLDVFSDKDGKKISLPCPAFVACRCSIYLRRPPVCRTYRCELLKRVEGNEIPLEAARSVVEQTLSARREAIAAAASSSDANAREVMCAWISAPGRAHAEAGYVELFFKFVVLQKYLDRYFRRNPRLR